MSIRGWHDNDFLSIGIPWRALELKEYQKDLIFRDHGLSEDLKLYELRHVGQKRCLAAHFDRWSQRANGNLQLLRNPIGVTDEAHGDPWTCTTTRASTQATFRHWPGIRMPDFIHNPLNFIREMLLYSSSNECTVSNPRSPCSLAPRPLRKEFRCQVPEDSCSLRFCLILSNCASISVSKEGHSTTRRTLEPESCFRSVNQTGLKPNASKMIFQALLTTCRCSLTPFDIFGAMCRIRWISSTWVFEI